MDNLPQNKDEINSCLNRIGRALETHVESGIAIGKELLTLKEIVPHGEYGKLVEEKFGLKKTMRLNYMSVAEIYGQKVTRVTFSSQVLIALSRPSVPEAAREAAEKEKSLTVKQAKELAQAYKRIEELKSPKNPDLDNLIPELRRKYKGAAITPGVANRLSILSEADQTLYLNAIESKLYAEKEKAKILSEKLTVLEDLNKLSREKEFLKKQLDEIATTSTAQVLLEKEAALKEARKEYDRQLIKQREDSNKIASELHERLNKERIEQAEAERDKAKKERKEAVETSNAAWAHQRELESKIKELEGKLSVDSPGNIDTEWSLKFNSLLTDVKYLTADCLAYSKEVGGVMEKTNEKVTQIIEILTNLKTSIDGQQIINI